MLVGLVIYIVGFLVIHLVDWMIGYLELVPNIPLSPYPPYPPIFFGARFLGRTDLTSPSHAGQYSPVLFGVLASALVCSIEQCSAMSCDPVNQCGIVSRGREVPPLRYCGVL